MQIQQEVLWNSSLGTRLKNPTPSLPSLSIPSLPSLSMPKVYRNRYDGRILRIVIYLVVWLCGFQFFFCFFGLSWVGYWKRDWKQLLFLICWLIIIVCYCFWCREVGVHGALQRPSQIVFYYQLGMKPLVSGFNLNGFVFLFLDLFIYFWILVWNQGDLGHSVSLLWWFWIMLTTFFLW